MVKECVYGGKGKGRELWGEIDGEDMWYEGRDMIGGMERDIEWRGIEIKGCDGKRADRKGGAGKRCDGKVCDWKGDDDGKRGTNNMRE